MSALSPTELRELAQELSSLLTTAAPSRLLDAVQAAELLDVPQSWVLAEARADRIPHVRLGRYVRFDAVELEAWWRSRTRGPWRSRGAAAGTAAAARIGSGPVPTARNPQ